MVGAIQELLRRICLPALDGLSKRASLGSGNFVNELQIQRKPAASIPEFSLSISHAT